MNPIAHIESPFDGKFGIPRQSGLVEVPARLVFEPEYRVAEALRGIEDFDYLWLIWQFSESVREVWSPTVRPPRLGGNQRMGVFATRSPFRPNAVGLSSVRLHSVQWHTPQGPVLHLLGCDLMNGTPVYDIKPYIPYTDSHPQARSGFAPQAPEARLQVCCDEALLAKIEPQYRTPLLQLLALDPRPQYQRDAERKYTFGYAKREVTFRVSEGTVQVLAIE